MLCIYLGQKGTGSVTWEMEEISSEPSDLCSAIQHKKETLPNVLISILQELPVSCLEGFNPNSPSRHKIVTLEL